MPHLHLLLRIAHEGVAGRVDPAVEDVGCGGHVHLEAATEPGSVQQEGGSKRKLIPLSFSPPPPPFVSISGRDQGCGEQEAGGHLQGFLRTSLGLNLTPSSISSRRTFCTRKR